MVSVYENGGTTMNKPILNEIKIIEKQNLLIIYFFGEIDTLVTQDYREKLSSLIEKKVYKNIVMDFQNVSFIDSSGIGMVFGRYSQIKRHGGNLYFTNLSKESYQLFAMTGIFKIVEYIEDQETLHKKLGEKLLEVQT